jgi:hypothetical protein
MKVSREDLINANTYGLKNKESFLSWFLTPVLQMAYEMGQNSIDISDFPVVTGYRYGKAPELGISYNYREDRSERGLSLAALEGEKEIGSSMWFTDRDIFKYSGILIKKGSDGEPVILVVDEVENLD